MERAEEEKMDNKDELSLETLEARKNDPREVRTVTFSVSHLYGLSRSSVRLPINEQSSIESGQICMMMDPQADATCNLGHADFSKNMIRVKYGVQAVFPGLFKMVMEKRYDPGLLNPIQATATDDCPMNADLTGFTAEGCLEFLPGSYWSGAHGG